MKCEYGCGQESKYILKNGKNCCSKNVASCPAIRKKISEKNKGKPKDDKWRKNLSESKKDSVPWNKGKNDYLTDDIKKSMGKKNVGRDPWNKGKTKIYSQKTLDSIRSRAKSRTGKKASNWKGGYYTKNIPLYENYITKLSYAEKCRRHPDDQNILQVQCTYCGQWFTPTIQQVYERVRTLDGNQMGEQRLYCSNKCKKECPIYGQHIYPKGFKQSTSREVQPELRQMRFEIDKYTCQKCFKSQKELKVGLHCHHIEGIRWEPLESADIDKVITLCKTCHMKVHKQKDCTYNDLRCK